jgi:hypothetical protein
MLKVNAFMGGEKQLLIPLALERLQHAILTIINHHCDDAKNFEFLNFR